jgi:hypothetical protein
MPELRQFNLETLPLKFWGLVRYDASGQLKDLIPVNHWATRALRKYKLLKEGRRRNGGSLDTLDSLESRARNGS